MKNGNVLRVISIVGNCIIILFLSVWLVTLALGSGDKPFGRICGFIGFGALFVTSMYDLVKAWFFARKKR